MSCYDNKLGATWDVTQDTSYSFYVCVLDFFLWINRLFKISRFGYIFRFTDWKVIE